MTATRILSSDREASLIHWLKKVDDVPGVAAECGVYCGSTLRMLAKAAPSRRVYGFDTFKGLPAAMWSAGEIHQPGDFADTSFEAVTAYVAQCPNVRLVRGEFPASTADVGDQFAFVHLDFDFYESTRAALEWLLPRMSPGGVIVFDDYEWHRCPGVKRAIDEVGLVVERTVPHQAVWVNSCPKCNGAGWVWADELDEYPGEPTGCRDDTKYSCDHEHHKVAKR